MTYTIRPHTTGAVAFGFSLLSISYILVERSYGGGDSSSLSFSPSHTYRLWQPANHVFLDCMGFMLSGGWVIFPYHLLAILRSFRYMHMDFICSFFVTIHFFCLPEGLNLFPSAVYNYYSYTSSSKYHVGSWMEKHFVVEHM